MHIDLGGAGWSRMGTKGRSCSAFRSRHGGFGSAVTFLTGRRGVSLAPFIVFLLFVLALGMGRAGAQQPLVRVDRVTSSTIELSWSGLAGDSAVHIYIAPEPAAAPGEPMPGQTLLAMVAGATNSYAIRELAAGVDVFLRVQSVGTTSSLTNDIRVRTVGGPRAVLDTPLREVHGLAPRILQLVIANPRTDFNGGGGVLNNRGAAWQGGQWTVQGSSGRTIPVLAVHRHSVPVGQPQYVLGYGGDWRVENHDLVDVDHRIYLVLGENILPANGTEILLLSHRGTSETDLRCLLPYSDRYLETPVLQVNQVGYNPGATWRWAYVSAWLGSGGGLDLSDFPARAAVLSEPAKPLLPRVTVLDGLPVEARSAFDDEAGAEVRQINLAGVPAAEGVRYRVYLPGIGVSWPTSVSKLAALKAFYVTARGLYHNRWGRELRPDSTEWSARPPDHPVIYTGEHQAEAFYSPDTPRTGVRLMQGGHHDAGDFDLRPMHTVIPQLLLRAFELNPEKYTDGQLDIPESGNGIPDLLDEALWNIQGWRQLQEADGGVRGGVESWRHPWGYYFADEEPFDEMPYWTYARDADTTARAAAVFAHAARLVARYNSYLAADLQASAVRAWNYALTHGVGPAPKLFAASELFLLTAQSQYKQAFEDVFVRSFLSDWQGNGPSQGDGVRNIAVGDLQKPDYERPQTKAMADYVVAYAKSPAANPTIASIIRANISSLAIGGLSRSDPAHAHRNLHGDIYTWGHSSALARHFMAVFADLQLGLTPEERQVYLDILSVNADHMLGGNPAGMVWTTGLGSRSPQEPLHLDSLAFIKNGYRTIPGIPIYGPVNYTPGSSYYQSSLAAFYPAFADQPPMHTFCDTRTFVVSSEFTSWETLAPNILLLACLLPEATERPESWRPGQPAHGSPLADLGSYHQADIQSRDNLITTEELNSYTAAWRTGATWPTGPNPIPVSYVARAAALWRSGGGYYYDPLAGPFPQSWVSTQTSDTPGGSSDANSVVRELPAEYWPETPIAVTLSVTASTNTVAWSVEEQLPSGWQASEISDNGVFDAFHGQVKWGPFYSADTRTLRYRTAGPGVAGVAARFVGGGCFDGAHLGATGQSLTVSQATSQPTHSSILTIRGQGIVRPNLAQMELQVGNRYTVVAFPMDGHRFSHWSGSVSSRSPSLTFEMRPGLVLEANFMPDPFAARKGTYHGLFYEQGGVDHQSSGFIRVTLTDRGRFSARLLLGGRSCAGSGQFDLDGRASATVARAGASPLSLQLQLDIRPGADQLAGLVTDGIWTADLLAYRSVFHARLNPAPWAGLYTTVIPGQNGDPSLPGGDGFATLSISRGGQVTWKGRLADNTPFVQRVPLSRLGHWPLYVPLYRRQGSLLGWVTVAPTPPGEVFQGKLSWIKPSSPASRYYPGGFATEALLLGSSYELPAVRGRPVLDFTEGILVLSGADLPGMITNRFALDLNNRFTTLGTHPMSLRLTVSRGLFQGNLTDAGTQTSFSFHGALVQSRTNAAGFFLRNGGSGTVRFGPDL